MKKEFIISEEVAEAQVDLFCNYYDIDLSDSAESQKEAVETARKKIIRAIRFGEMEISLDDEDDPIIKQMIPIKGGGTTDIEYGVLSGKHKKAMTKQEEFGKMYSLLGSLSGLGETAISKLKGRHLSTAECIGMFFLQV